MWVLYNCPCKKKIGVEGLCTDAAAEKYFVRRRYSFSHDRDPVLHRTLGRCRVQRAHQSGKSRAIHNKHVSGGARRWCELRAPLACARIRAGRAAISGVANHARFNFLARRATAPLPRGFAGRPSAATAGCACPSANAGNDTASQLSAPSPPYVHLFIAPAWHCAEPRPL